MLELDNGMYLLLNIPDRTAIEERKKVTLCALKPIEMLLEQARQWVSAVDVGAMMISGPPLTLD